MCFIAKSLARNSAACTEKSYGRNPDRHASDDFKTATPPPASQCHIDTLVPLTSPGIRSKSGSGWI
jgi:hypothetical protein